MQLRIVLFEEGRDVRYVSGLEEIGKQLLKRQENKILAILIVSQKPSRYKAKGYSDEWNMKMSRKCFSPVRDNIFKDFSSSIRYILLSICWG